MHSLSFWRGKQVFITGYTGFKGAWLCKTLEILGANVTGYALEPPIKPNLFNICKPEAASVTGDIRDYDKLLATLEKVRPEIVIHMSAQPLVLDSYRQPRHTYEVNVMGTVNILECLRLNGSVKSILNVTTDKVYLNTERKDGYSEDEKLNGFDPYSNSKSCSELITDCYNNSFFKQTGVSVSTTRSGNVIGGGDFSGNRLVPDCYRALAKNEKIKIRNPDAVRPYLHVLDTLFVYLEIAQKQYLDSAFVGSYNIAPNEEDCVSSKELAGYFCEAWGNGADWEHVPVDSNPHESGILKLDCSKIKKVLGWEQKWDIKKSVKNTAMWYRAYFNGGEPNRIMREQIEYFIKTANGVYNKDSAWALNERTKLND